MVFKRFFILSFFVLHLSACFSLLSFQCCSVPKVEDVKNLVPDFTPDVYITKQNDQDKALLAKMKDLFFEVEAGSPNPKANVYQRAVRDYGAQERMLLTQDNFKISTLYFKREHAPFNIICVTGYFHDETPVKEWAAPFAVLFPNVNILSFDWRGFGDSQGRKGKWTFNEFGPDAYRDVQAAIDFMRKENDKPIILVGFCFGAAMGLHATLKAQEEGNSVADALCLDSIFDDFYNMAENAFFAEGRWYRRCFMYPSVIKLFLDYHLQGDIFELKPIEMVQKVTIPCLFNHFTYDPSATILQGKKVFDQVKGFKVFIKSDVGRHVRIHSKVPCQYRDAFYDFLLKSGLLSKQDFISLKSNDLNFEICDTMRVEARA